MSTLQYTLSYIITGSITKKWAEDSSEDVNLFILKFWREMRSRDKDVHEKHGWSEWKDGQAVDILFLQKWKVHEDGGQEEYGVKYVDWDVKVGGHHLQKYTFETGPTTPNKNRW